MDRRRWAWAAAVTLLATASAARAVTEAQFEIRNGADLVALCDAGADDPLRAEALQMCQGFAVGVYRTILDVTSRDRIRLFCPPDPPPRRNEAIARFVAWAKAHPEHQSEDAVDLIGRHLIEAYPCPKTEAAEGAARKGRHAK